jgi:inhibitor of KinA sporulation pathway (predicted exonuclease)
MGNAYDCDVVIDLEFTLVPGGAGPGRPAAEIIEVGAVMLAPDGSVAGEFSRMVRPTFAHGPSHEVRMLTGIRGCDLACAATLAEALGTTLDALVSFDGGGLGLGAPPRGRHLFGNVKVGERGRSSSRRKRVTCSTFNLATSLSCWVRKARG